ncbi:putative zinc finger CCCH domain-containing protein 2 [Sesbania bispinosa]|nr:putative zinc finger CCCH domain-containing protein 2 [Sesbania bispinosa]
MGRIASERHVSLHTHINSLESWHGNSTASPTSTLFGLSHFSPSVSSSSSKTSPPLSPLKMRNGVSSFLAMVLP